MRFQWSPDMKVYAEPIDQQHERLVNMLCALQDAIADHHPPTVRRLVLDLVSYTRYHFHTEENLMRARAWPAFEAHRAAHAIYRERLLALERRMVQERQWAAGKDIEDILVD